VIQDVLDKILGVCDGATPEARKTGSGLVDRAAVTLEFYSVSYDQDGMTQNLALSCNVASSRHHALRLALVLGAHGVPFVKA